MRDWSGKRYWLVGASAGLGAAVAPKLSALGCEVILSARNEDDLHKVAEGCSGPTQVVTVDIADDDSVAAAAEAVGDVDGIVFLAGVYWPQSAQEWDARQVTTMMDVNLTGAVRVLGQVVPKMVARDSGHIVITGSIGGYRGLPGAIGYAASKAGTRSLAESMYADLRGTGVDVQLINPGYIKTRLTEKNDFNMPFIMEPEAAAQEFVDHMQNDRFQKSYPAFFGFLFRATQFLPDWAYFRLFSS